MCRKKIIILLYLVITTSLSMAQSDFRPGFIIKNDEEKTQGFIDYRNDYLNCNKCVFKEDINVESVTYLPGEIKAYRFIDSKYYISTFIEEFKKDVFLEFLIDGIVDIYYYKDFQKEYYYANKNDSSFCRLNNDKRHIIKDDVYVKTINGMSKTSAEFTFKSNEHIGILKYFFSDSRISLAQVDQVGLSHKSLINIAKQYHQDVCSDEACIVFEKQLPPASFDLDLLFNSAYTGLNISNSSDYDGFSYDADFNFAFGVGLSIHPSRFSDRLAIYLQFIYGENKFKSSYIEEGLAGGLNYFYSDHEISFLSNSLGLKYTFPIGKMRPELIFAYTYHYTVKSHSERLIEEEMANGLRSNTYSDDILNINYNGISIIAGVSILKTKNTNFIMNLQYQYFGGSSEKPSIHLCSTKLGLGIRL